jgi:hypothetical protein
VKRKKMASRDGQVERGDKRRAHEREKGGSPRWSVSELSDYKIEMAMTGEEK